jgi:peptide/nickel transport system permease protein
MIDPRIDTATPAVMPVPKPQKRLPRAQWLGGFVRNPTAMIGLFLVAFWLFMAIFGSALAPYGVNEMTAGAVWQPVSYEHPLGTDQLGRDIFSRILVGTQQMVLLPTLSVLLALLLGVTIGMTAGYTGGWADEIIMRVMDVMMAFPVLMLYLIIIVVVGASAVNVVVALGVGATPAVARLTRGLVLDLRDREFVAAARMRGESNAYILFREIFPNIMPPLLVDGLVRIGYACFAMGALGFLGLGVPPPAPDWGQMVSQARNALIITPTAPLFPAFAIASLVVGFNLVADGLTEAMKVD